MKKLILALMAIIGTSLGVHAQTFMNGGVLTRAKAAAIIHFKDGSQQEYGRINIPALSDGKVTIFDEDKKRTSIKASEIECLEVWNENMPEKHHLIYYCESKYPMYGSVWGAVIGIGEYAMAFQLGNTYSIDDEGGLHYYLDSGTVGSMIIYYNRYTKEWLNVPTHKKLAKLFGDDEKLSEKIAAKKLGNNDAQYIVENYHPKK